MKKDNAFLNRYFWWPVVSVADWIGGFMNHCPPAKKVYHSQRFAQIRKRIRPETDPKGSPHADSKIFNHPRR